MPTFRALTTARVARWCSTAERVTWGLAGSLFEPGVDDGSKAFVQRGACRAERCVCSGAGAQRHPVFCGQRFGKSGRQRWIWRFERLRQRRPASTAAAPSEPWSTDWVTVDCTGRFRLCFTIKALAAPLSPAEKRQQRIFIVPFLLAFLLVPLLSTVAFLHAGGDAPFLTAYGHAFLVLNIANLFDAVVIDWLFLYVMKPRFAIIPEAWGRLDTMNIGWQVRNYFKGIIFCAVFAVPVALVATLL